MLDKIDDRQMTAALQVNRGLGNIWGPGIKSNTCQLRTRSAAPGPCGEYYLGCGGREVLGASATHPYWL